jgi:hypothetical protein
VYQIPAWDRCHENNKSRERDSCRFAFYPNKLDGLGFVRLMNRADGATSYGIFHMLVALCSAQRRPRNGYLTEDGARDGRPLDAVDLALKFRRPQAEIQAALDVLSDPAIGWLVRHERGAVSGQCPDSARAVPAECPPSAQEGKGKEGKEGNGKKASAIADACTEPPQAAASVPAAVLEFPVCAKNGAPKVWPLTSTKVAEYGATFPAVDVLAESRRALQWVRDNPTKKKTAKGMPAFLHRWFGRVQDQGGTHGRENRRGVGGEARPGFRSPDQQGDFADLRRRAVTVRANDAAGHAERSVELRPADATNGD